MQQYTEQYPSIVNVFHTSAELSMEGMKELRDHLYTLTQPGPWLYPAQQKTDQADLSRVEDIIRSKLYELLKLPYGVKQANAGWTELEDDVLRIDQNLIVDRPGMKVTIAIWKAICSAS